MIISISAGLFKLFNLFSKYCNYDKCIGINHVDIQFHALLFM